MLSIQENSKRKHDSLGEDLERGRLIFGVRRTGRKEDTVPIYQEQLKLLCQGAIKVGV